MGGVILVKILLDLYYKIMIIKRKLFNISDREELERLKSIKPTLGKRLAATGALGGTGALLGFAGGRGGALLGGTIGAATGAYVTSNYFRKKQINKLQKRIDSDNIRRNSLIDNRRINWENQRPMTYDQFYKKYPKVKSDMNRVKFNENYRFTDNSIPDYNQIKNIWGEFDPKRYIPLGVQDAYESSYMFYDTKTGDYVNVWSDIEEPERIKRLDDYKEFYS